MIGPTSLIVGVIKKAQSHTTILTQKYQGYSVTATYIARNSLDPIISSSRITCISTNH